jgi:outer membrane protein TolC
MEPFETREAGLDDPYLITSDERIYRYVNDPWTLSLFREFMVAEGLDRSVELRRLDAAIRAQERSLSAAKRTFYAPTAALAGEVTQDLVKGGAGTEPPSLPPGFASAFPESDDTDWSVGIELRLPLVEGGGRIAEMKRNQEELMRLQLERAATRERIEQRVQAAITRMGYSYPSIRLSREAAEAALKNLELVRDSYSRGVVSILDLIDAQSAALVSSQVAANAVNNFLIDLMELQRAINHFDFFTSSQKREEWFRRMEAFFEKRETPAYQP